jgi:hypothetical protein
LDDDRLLRLLPVPLLGRVSWLRLLVASSIGWLPIGWLLLWLHSGDHDVSVIGIVHAVHGKLLLHDLLLPPPVAPPDDDDDYDDGSNDSSNDPSNV